LTADAADEKLSEERIAEESAKVLKVQRSGS
jgi:hypothetical protein